MIHDLNLNIYSSLPKNVFETQINNNDINNVLTLLKNNKNKFYKSGEIAKLVNLPKRATNVEVRQVITHLIIEFKQPIISNHKGYCYTDNPILLKKYSDELKERCRAIQLRSDIIKHLSNNINEI